MIVRYDKFENVIAIGDNCHDLARLLGITYQAISHGLHRGSKLYAYIPDEEIRSKDNDKSNK